MAKLTAKEEKQRQQKWDKRFMEACRLIGTWSSCIRPNRQVGSIVVKNNRILATGYNGAPAGVKSCAERGVCMREKLHIPSGTRQEACFSVHAEQNAIAQAAKLGHEVDGATIYITHSPCSICARLIINAGIKRVIYDQNYPDDFSASLLKEAGVKLEHYKE